MKKITESLYDQLAQMLIDKIHGRAISEIVITGDFEDLEWELKGVFTCLFKTDIQGDGREDLIIYYISSGNVTFTMWDEDGEKVPNDFEMYELRKYML